VGEFQTDRTLWGRRRRNQNWHRPFHRGLQGGKGGREEGVGGWVFVFVVYVRIDLPLPPSLPPSLPLTMQPMTAMATPGK